MLNVTQIEYLLALLDADVRGPRPTCQIQWAIQKELEHELRRANAAAQRAAARNAAKRSRRDQRGPII